MTKYFVAEVRLFDEEDFQDEESVKRRLEEGIDTVITYRPNMVWEDVKVKEVELEEYEKED